MIKIGNIVSVGMVGYCNKKLNMIRMNVIYCGWWYFVYYFVVVNWWFFCVWCNIFYVEDNIKKLVIINIIFVIWNGF